MKISSIIDIVDGKLLNHPSISFIYSFKSDPSKVKEGDLFIAKNHNDIKMAIDNGAFAILVDENCPILDNEIAWIKVESINQALINIIRYKLANLNIEAYYFNKITFELLNIFSQQSTKEIFFLSNLDEFVKDIDLINNNSIIVSYNKELLNKVYPMNIELNEKSYEVKNLSVHSLFETSYSFNDIYYSKIRIPALYYKNLLMVQDFLDVELDLTRLKQFSFFKPIFITKTEDITEYGKSERFIIAQEDINISKKEIAFIKKRFTYAKTIVISSDYNCKHEHIYLKDIKNIKDVLKTNSFNAAYFIGFSYEDIYSVLEKSEEQNTLF